MTFSIVAYSPEEHAWGVAVASKFMAAAAMVNWARADAGAVATQSFVRVSYGSDGLDLMQAGLSADEALRQLLASDPEAAQRQVAMIDRNGNAAAHTGAACFDWAGHRLGQNYSVQGNILAGENVLQAMMYTFETTGGELAERMVAALLAGDRAGGDRRGRQSAGLLVVKPRGGYGGDNDRWIDLRVDDDSDPVARLHSLLEMHHLYFHKDDPAVRIPIDRAIATELQTMLTRLGYYQGPVDGEWSEAPRRAFWAFCGTENFEERWSLTDHPDLISPALLDFIRKRWAP
jgi:uncharacterized Ntn-hydrolase superfamily protein